MERLYLYHYDSCMFCRRVRMVIEQLNVEVELRNIWQDSQHRDDLARARGRTTVPVLRRMGEDYDEWMPESRDIIEYLRSNYS